MSITDGEAVERENVRLRVIVKDLHWLARRYCDGRMSYVTSLFNQHTRDLVEMGVRLEVTADADGTIWARDGMGRNLDHLTDEEAALGRPLEDWQPRTPADQDEHLRLRSDLSAVRARLAQYEAALQFYAAPVLIAAARREQEAREIIERLTFDGAPKDPAHPDECLFCSADASAPGVHHDDDCYYGKARAWLAALKGEG